MTVLPTYLIQLTILLTLRILLTLLLTLLTPLTLALILLKQLTLLLIPADTRDLNADLAVPADAEMYQSCLRNCGNYLFTCDTARSEPLGIPPASNEIWTVINAFRALICISGWF